MANEITTMVAWTVAKNGKSRSLALLSELFTMAGNGFVDSMQAVGFAAHEALILGEVTAPGFSWFRNSDATNYVEIGYDTAGTFRPFIRLNAGQSCTCWLSVTAAAPYARANTASVNLDYMICDR